MCQDRNDRMAVGISLIKLFEVKLMKKRRFGWTAFVFFVICVVSCTANLEVRKKQEVASRNLGEAYLETNNQTLGCEMSNSLLVFSRLLIPNTVNQ